MQQISAALQSVFDNGINGDPTLRDFAVLFEFYEYDTLPGVNGFDPANAVQKFAREEITWLGLAYRRIVLGVSDINLSMEKSPNNCTLRLSNSDENRTAAAWVTQNDIEGMRMVVRIISLSASVALTDSTVRFVGKCEKPVGFDVIQGSITALTDIGSAEHVLPPRIYQADDPDGRSPADPNFLGFPFITIHGSFVYLRIDPNKRRPTWATKQWSSFDETPLGDPIPIVFGRAQHKLENIIFADKGRYTDRLDIGCMGQVYDFLNIRVNYPPETVPYFSQPTLIQKHLGEPGGTGTQIVDTLFPTHGLFSNTAFISFRFHYIGTGSFAQIDRGHDCISVIMGTVMPTPNSSGVFGGLNWTDNGAYQTRFILTNERYFRLNEAFIEDSACWETGRFNDEPRIDDTNAEQILIPSPEQLAAGIRFQRFNSTGLINPRRVHFYDFGDGVRPEITEVIPDDFIIFPFDLPPTLIADVRHLRKNFTTNVILKERMKGLDFLYDVILKSFRGYLVWNSKGKIEIRSERPPDFAHLRNSTIASATSVPVEDVTAWAASLWGKVAIGTPHTTSETRKVTAYAYTTDANSIALSSSASGTVTATASGATLLGGTASIRASGTVTLGGTAQAGAQATVTLNGVQAAYTLNWEDTLGTAASMLASMINAHSQLRRFVSAEWSSGTPNVITIRSKWGVLTVPALVNPHTGAVANPTVAPTLAASAGSLSAGTYRVAYSDVNVNGETYISPYSTITIGVNQKIDVAALALPAGSTSRNWYISKQPGETAMAYVTNTNGSAHSINSLPLVNAVEPPEYNTTGEECVRVAISFASDNQGAAILAQAGLTRGNIFAGTYKWPLSNSQPSFNQIIATHNEASDDFAEKKYELNDSALQLKTGKKSPREMNLTAVDNFHQARRLVGFEFSKHIDHHWFNSFRAHAPAILLDEGDVICASDDSGGHVNILTKVEELTIHLADQTFTASIKKARHYSTRMFSEKVGKHNPLMPSVLQWVTTLTTQMVIGDLPLLRPQDEGSGVYVWLSFDTSQVGKWTEGSVWVDFGDGLSLQMENDVAATLGETLTELGTGTQYGLDSTSTVRVRVKFGTLTSTDDSGLAKGVNRCVIAGEVLQFRDAVLVFGTTMDYDISNFFRGLDGTEDQMTEHAIGDSFALVNGAEVFLPIDPQHLNKDLTFRAVTRDEDLADASATDQVINWTGRSLKHYSPIINHTRDTAGNILIDLSQRSRRFGGIRDYLRIPDADEEVRFGLQLPQATRDVIYLTARSVGQVMWSEQAGTRNYKGGESASQLTIAADGSIAKVLPSGQSMTVWARSAQILSGNFALRFAVPSDNMLPQYIGLERLVPYAQTPNASDIEFYFGADYSGAGFLSWDRNHVEGTTLATVAGDLLTIIVKDGVVSYYKGTVDETSVPLKVSTRTAKGMYRIIFYSAAVSFGIHRAGAIDKPRVAGDIPSFFYSTDMQIADFGSVRAPGTLQVRAWQESSIVGKGIVAEVTV
jgi:hypothetical protein